MLGFMMLHGDTREETRGVFFSSWVKYKTGLSLSALETQVVAVIQLHPMYHTFFEHQQAVFQHDKQDNPFLHLGLHLAVRDQIALDRPSGISAIYQALYVQYKDAHTAEHVLMECFSACLWTAQNRGALPDEQTYLHDCRQALTSKTKV
jgi:hypothetical protein